MHNTDNLTILDPLSNTSKGVVQTGGAKIFYKELLRTVPPEVLNSLLRTFAVSQQSLVKIDWWLRNIDQIMGNMPPETEERFQRWVNGR